MPALNLIETNATKTSLKIKALASAPRLRVEGDEIFPELTRITCRVCGDEERVPLDYPALVCSTCITDIAAAARRVADEYAHTMAAFFEAGEALTKISQGDEWYAKTERARGDMTIPPVTFARAWAVAKSAGGDKAKLVSLRDNLDEAAELMRAAELRYIAASPELEAARAALGEPIDV